LEKVFGDFSSESQKNHPMHILSQIIPNRINEYEADGLTFDSRMLWFTEEFKVNSLNAMFVLIGCICFNPNPSKCCF